MSVGCTPDDNRVRRRIGFTPAYPQGRTGKTLRNEGYVHTERSML